MSSRADNADLRLTEKGRAAGIVGDKRWNQFRADYDEMEGLKALLLRTKLSSSGWIERGFRVHHDTDRRSAFDLLRLPGVTVETLSEHIPEILRFSPRARTRIGIEGVYAPYVAQQKAAMRVFEKDENLRLPQDLDYSSIHGLSVEECQMLQMTRPESVGQARRIEGITPTGALRLLAFVRMTEKKVRSAAAYEQMIAKREQYASL